MQQVVVENARVDTWQQHRFVALGLRFGQEFGILQRHVEKRLCRFTVLISQIVIIAIYLCQSRLVHGGKHRLRVSHRQFLGLQPLNFAQKRVGSDGRLQSTPTNGGFKQRAVLLIGLSLLFNLLQNAQSRLRQIFRHCNFVLFPKLVVSISKSRLTHHYK